MNQHTSLPGIPQYNNLVQNLIRHGLTPDQIYSLSMPVMPVHQPHGLAGSNNTQMFQATNDVKHESESMAFNKPETSYDEGLLLKMFGTFCVEQPQSAKEMSIAFTKFARWMQSTIDKNS